jgi:hypothetical protein
MKLLDRAFDRALELAAPVQALAIGLKAVAEQLQALGGALAAVARNQAAHQLAIQNLWRVQQDIFRKLQASSLDVSMPKIDAPKADDKDQATADRKKAASKPN